MTGWRRRAVAALLLLACAAASAQPEPPQVHAAEGGWRLQTDAAGQVLTLFDAQGQVAQVYPARNLDGRRSGRVVALQDLPCRRSFAVAFAGLGELWEISYDPAAPPVYDGLVHDYRMGEAVARAGFLGVRRAPLETAVTALRPGRHCPQLWLQVEPATAGAPNLLLLNLDVRRAIAAFTLAGRPDLDAGHWVERDGRWLLLLPDRDDAARGHWIDDAARSAGSGTR